MVVSESLENYLRTLYELQIVNDVVRVKDIAKTLKVRTASVVEAIKKLKKKGLVEHEQYGYIKLTQVGVWQAHKVYEKHRTIFRFLTEILFIDKQEAEELACGIEHHLTEKSISQLEKFINYFVQNPEEFNKFKDFISREVEMMTLDKFRPGDSLKVVKIVGEPQIKNRLLNMGFLPETRIYIERIAPLGDPIEVKVKGFRLSLRKEEARVIVVVKE